MVGLPVRQKGDISINTNLFFRMCLKAVTPLVSQKIKDRMIHLGGKQSELEKYVDTRMLTTEFYGTRNKNDCLGYLDPNYMIKPKVPQTANIMPPSIPSRPGPPIPARPLAGPSGSSLGSGPPPIPQRPAAIVPNNVETGNLIDF